MRTNGVVQLQLHEIRDRLRPPVRRGYDSADYGNGNERA